jgi:hypothetical protein
MPKKFLKASGWLLQILVIGNLCFATAFNLEAEYFARYEYFPNFHYFSTPICVVGLMICIYCFLANKNKDGTIWQTLHYLPFILITLGTLASGSITYTGEDSPSFWVILMNTSILVPVSVFFFWKLGKRSILGIFFLIYSPSLSYYSAQQWVQWNTALFSKKIYDIEGWNFEVNEWKWFCLDSVNKEDVIIYNWTPFFQRFAIKSKEKDYYGKGREPDILYSVEKIEGRLLVTHATHVKWNSSGETGVWPSR